MNDLAAPRLPRAARDAILEALKRDEISGKPAMSFLGQLESVAWSGSRELRETAVSSKVPPREAVKDAKRFLANIERALGQWRSMGGQMREHIGSGLPLDPEHLHHDGGPGRHQAIEQGLEEIRSAAEMALTVLEHQVTIPRSSEALADARADVLELVILHHRRLLRDVCGCSQRLGLQSPARAIGAAFFQALLKASGDAVRLAPSEEPEGFGAAWTRATKRIAADSQRKNSRPQGR